ncbi:MAG: CDP-alcohol phosphatidyltransferase family protein [Elusimicrobia bacterium]|nr:CDP-alcohol phosphatidyltransferase family protein [Elusimicrobiota bacterium]
MTDNAVLLAPRPQLLFERVAGLTVLERHLHAARRAGISQLCIGATRPGKEALAALRLPDGLEVTWAQRDASRECPTPYLLLSADHFIRVETLRYIAQSAYRSHVTLEDGAGAAVVQVIPFRTEKIPAPVRQPLPVGASVYLDMPVGGGPELTWLLAAGVKSQDGFMARHFDRYISLALSRLLLNTPVTPNMMTVMSSLLGLAGAGFFLLPSYASRLTGAALIWLHSVLDGCDGELARLRFQESRWGGILDFWGDNLVHLALFLCMAWGFYIADNSVLPLILGVASAVGTLGSAVLVYLERSGRRMEAATDPSAGAGIQSTLTKIENMLAARDFIYLLLLLAYIDRLYEFLWATAVGSLLFFAMMLYLRGDNDEQASQPHPPREGQAGNTLAGDGSGHQHLYSGR